MSKNSSYREFWYYVIASIIVNSLVAVLFLAFIPFFSSFPLFLLVFSVSFCLGLIYSHLLTHINFFIAFGVVPAFSAIAMLVSVMISNQVSVSLGLVPHSALLLALTYGLGFVLPALIHNLYKTH